MIFLVIILLMANGITEYTKSFMSKEVSGLNLMKLRQDLGWTIQEVANELGISRQKYSRIEKAPEELKDFFLADKIASIFSVPVEFLFERYRKRLSPLTLPKWLSERGNADRNT